MKREESLKQISNGERVLAAQLLDIRLEANITRSHFSRLSGISPNKLRYYETEAFSVPVSLYRLYIFYASCSRIFGPVFYLERSDPVTDQTILAWVKEMGGTLNFHRIGPLEDRLYILAKEQSKRCLEILKTGFYEEPEEIAEPEFFFPSGPKAFVPGCYVFYEGEYRLVIIRSSFSDVVLKEYRFQGVQK